MPWATLRAGEVSWLHPRGPSDSDWKKLRLNPEQESADGLQKAGEQILETLHATLSLLKPLNSVTATDGNVWHY